MISVTAASSRERAVPSRAWIEIPIRNVSKSVESSVFAELDRVSALPIGYPGWMLDLWSKGRRDQLAAQRLARSA